MPNDHSSNERRRYRSQLDHNSLTCLSLQGTYLVALQHAVDQVTQWAPKVLSASKVMLVNEENVVLEAGVKMRLKTQLTDDRVVVAVDVCVNTVHSLEDGTNGRWECPWE